MRETKFRLFGKRDAETGLDYRGARFYDAYVARFLSLNPHASDYPSLSDYCYVAGNPIIFIDPYGKDVIDSDMKKNNGRYRNSYIRFINTKSGRNILRRFSSKNNGSSLNFLKKSKNGDMSKHTLYFQMGTNEEMSNPGSTLVYLRTNKKDVGLSNITTEDIKNSDLKFIFVINVREATLNDAANGSVTIGHEAILHAKEYVDGINNILNEYKNGSLKDEELVNKLTALKESAGKGGKNHHDEYASSNHQHPLKKYFNELFEDVGFDSKKVSELNKAIKDHDDRFN